MSTTVAIQAGEIAVAKGSGLITTGSVGSCIVIVLYDSTTKTGGLGHAMLPENAPNELLDPFSLEPGNRSGKYVTQAIDNLLAGITHFGGIKQQLIAKLVGGASMFRRLISDDNSIGNRNVTKAREHLQSLGVPIENEDTGGNTGKSVILHLENGLVEINTII